MLQLLLSVIYQVTRVSEWKADESMYALFNRHGICMQYVDKGVQKVFSRSKVFCYNHNQKDSIASVQICILGYSWKQPFSGTSLGDYYRNT